MSVICPSFFSPQKHGEIHRSNLRAGARVEGEQAWRAQAQDSHLALKPVYSCYYGMLIVPKQVGCKYRVSYIVISYLNVWYLDSKHISYSPFGQSKTASWQTRFWRWPKRFVRMLQLLPLSCFALDKHHLQWECSQQIWVVNKNSPKIIRELWGVGTLTTTMTAMEMRNAKSTPTWTCRVNVASNPTNKLWLGPQHFSQKKRILIHMQFLCTKKITGLQLLIQDSFQSESVLKAHNVH